MGAGTTSNTREGRTVAVTGDMVGGGEGEHKGTETEGKGKGTLKPERLTRTAAREAEAKAATGEADDVTVVVIGDDTEVEVAAPGGMDVGDAEGSVAVVDAGVAGEDESAVTAC